MTVYKNLKEWEYLSKRINIPNYAIINNEPYFGSGEVLEIINPATREVLTKIASCNEQDINYAIKCARNSFEEGLWALMPKNERKKRLLYLAELIYKNRAELALLDTLNMGKPITETYDEDIPASASHFAWFAELIDKQYDEIAPTDSDSLATITREPLGVVAAVVPWNYPFMMASWKVAPALAAGNSVILKPANITPLSAIRLGELAIQAGIPKGVLNIVPGTGSVAGQALGLHPDVDCVAFTGSTATGKRFMQYSGQSNLKQIWLECGGKSPHIIFEDCPDLDAAAKAATIGIFSNQGEVCIAGSRLYIQESIYELFIDKLLNHAKQLKLGNPLDPDTQMGAIVNQEQWKQIIEYIEIGKQEGAQLLTGGKPTLMKQGFYIEPTIMTVERQDLRIVQEEIFGPVLVVSKFKTEEEVIKYANQSIYGLGAGLWTANLSRAHRVTRALKSGLVWINCYFNSNDSIPFGGVKQSGFGRDKSIYALDKYSSIKSAWFNLTH